MELKDTALPLHKNATAKIRPRIFLEGNFFVDLKPGTPGSPQLDSGDTIAITQTSTPVQLEKAEAAAREVLPDLGQRLEKTPWRGARPCTPDMMPIIGKAPRHDGLSFVFGHAHHGMTLGPVTGRLVAEMMTGEAPFVDPKPYRAERLLQG